MMQQAMRNVVVSVAGLGLLLYNHHSLQWHRLLSVPTAPECVCHRALLVRLMCDDARLVVVHAACGPGHRLVQRLRLVSCISKTCTHHLYGVTVLYVAHDAPCPCHS